MDRFRTKQTTALFRKFVEKVHEHRYSWFGATWVLVERANYSDSALREAFRRMNRMDALPWPAENCLLMMPLDDGKRKFFVGFYVENGKLSATACVEDGRDLFACHPLEMVRVQDLKCSREYGKHSLASLILDGAEGNGWIAFEGDKPNVSHTFGVLWALINIVMPCGYVAKTTLHGSWGSRLARKAIKGKELLLFIKKERLYAYAAKAVNGCRKLLHRCAHLRYLWWLSAKIDRKTLPKNAEDRLAIAKAKGVRSVLVQEFNGQCEFDDPTGRTEIQKKLDWFSMPEKVRLDEKEEQQEDAA